MKTSGPGVQNHRHLLHDAQQRDHVGKTGEYSADRTLVLRALSIHEVGLNGLEPTTNRANATKVAGSHPTDLRHVKAVEPDVVGQFLRRFDRLTNARNDMHLNLLRQRSETG